MKVRNRRRLFVYVLVLTGNLVFIAQNTDSLFGVFKNATQPDSSRFWAINSLVNLFRSNDPDSAIKIAGKQLELSVKMQNKSFEGRALYNIGACYFFKTDYDNALNYFNKGLAVFDGTAENELKPVDLKTVGNIQTSMGLIFSNQSRYAKALEHYFKALKIQEKIKDESGAGYTYYNIGLVYSAQQNYKNALNYFLTSLKIRKRIDHKFGIGNSLNGIGSIYYAQHDYLKAISYFQSALKLNEEANYKIGVADAYNNLGEAYSSLSETEKSVYYKKKALDMRKEIGDKNGTIMSFLNLALAYNTSKSFKMGLKYTDSAFKLSKELNDINYQRKSYESYSVVYAGLGDYKSAYEHHLKFKKLTDSIFNNDNSKTLSELRTKFEVEKKEMELRSKAEEREARQRLILYSILSILLLVLIFSIFLYSRFRIIQKQKKIIEHQKKVVDEKQKDILDSIYYAKRIQNSLLPTEKYIQKKLNGKTG